MPPLALSTPPVVVLDPIRHGLVDPARGCPDLDVALDRARAAEREGAACVVVPGDGRHRPDTAAALAVLLATERIRVVVAVDAAVWRTDAVARFATGATRLAGDRLTVQVLGVGADRFAAALRRAWDGEVVTDPTRPGSPGWPELPLDRGDQEGEIRSTPRRSERVETCLGCS